MIPVNALDLIQSEHRRLKTAIRDALKALEFDDPQTAIRLLNNALENKGGKV